MRIVSQAVSENRDSLIQVVHRVDPADLDSSGEYAVVITRYDLARGADSVLDATNGEILDNRVSTARLEERINWPITPPASTATSAADSEAQAEAAEAKEDYYRHGIPQTNVSMPCQHLDFSGEEFDETLYSENPTGLEDLVSGEHLEAVVFENNYDEAYISATFIPYAAITPPPSSSSSEDNLARDLDCSVSSHPLPRPLNFSNLADVFESSLLEPIAAELSLDQDHRDMVPLQPEDIGGVSAVRPITVSTIVPNSSVRAKVTTRPRSSSESMAATNLITMVELPDHPVPLPVAASSAANNTNNPERRLPPRPQSVKRRRHTLSSPESDTSSALLSTRPLPRRSERTRKKRK